MVCVYIYMCVYIYIYTYTQMNMYIYIIGFSRNFCSDLFMQMTPDKRSIMKMLLCFLSLQCYYSH